MTSEAHEEMMMEAWLIANVGLAAEVAHDLVVRDRHHTMNRRRQLKGILSAWQMGPQ